MHIWIFFFFFLPQFKFLLTLMLVTTFTFKLSVLRIGPWGAEFMSFPTHHVSPDNFAGTEKAVQSQFFSDGRCLAMPLLPWVISLSCCFASSLLLNPVLSSPKHNLCQSRNKLFTQALFLLSKLVSAGRTNVAPIWAELSFIGAPTVAMDTSIHCVIVQLRKTGHSCVHFPICSSNTPLADQG